MPRKILVVNQSAVVASDDFQRVVRAIQQQIDNHFAPAWGLSAELVIAEADDPGSESILILDDSDQAGALGYHEEQAGAPKGFVFARTDQQYGADWSATFSHEALEQLADPYANLVSFSGLPASGNSSVGWAYESCDPVENDEYDVTLDDGAGGTVAVSNFILPSWFVPDSPGPYDFLGHLTRPGQLSPGGYAAILFPGSGWSQIFGHKTPSHQGEPGLFSRRDRRLGELTGDGVFLTRLRAAAKKVGVGALAISFYFLTHPAALAAFYADCRTGNVQGAIADVLAAISQGGVGTGSGT